MRAFKKNLILLLVFILSFAIPLFVFRAIDLPNFKREQESKKAETNVYIISVPPKQAVIGKVWQYGVSIKNYSPDKYNVVIKKPTWLMWDKEKLLLKGEVPTNIKSFQVEIEVLDNNNKVLDKQSVEVKVVDSILNLKPEIMVATLDKNAVGSRFIGISHRNEKAGASAVLGVQTTRVPRTGMLDSIMWGIFIAGSFIPVGILLRRRKSKKQDINIAVIKGTIK